MPRKSSPPQRESCAVCSAPFPPLSKTPTTTRRYTLLLTPRQLPRRVCGACAEREGHAALHPPRALARLCGNLASMNAPLPGARILDSVRRGAAARLRIAHGLAAPAFESLQEVCDFTWFLVAASAHKRQQFTSGVFVFEDPRHRVLQALSQHGYSRVLKTVRGVVSEAKSFGSSHFIDFILWSRSVGRWHVPEEGVAAGPVQGYEQIGIDLRKRLLGGAAAGEANAYCGVYLMRRHLLAGKLPNKTGNDGARQYSFCKLETHGTKRTSEAVGHAMSFLSTRRGKGRMSTSSMSSVDGPSIIAGHNNGQVKVEKSKTAEQTHSPAPSPPRTTDTAAGDSASTASTATAPNSANGVPTRKEHAPKVMCDIFTQIVRIAHTACSIKMHSNSGALTLDEITTKRPKILGLSFMSGIVDEIAANMPRLRAADAIPSNANVGRLEALLAQWKANFSSDWDHLDVRFGQEVIFGASELDDFSAAVMAAGRARRLFGRVKSSTRKLQQLSTRSLRQLSRRTKRSWSATAAATVMGVGAVLVCACHAYGLLLLSRRVLGLSPPWRMPVTPVLGLGAVA